MDFQMPVTLVVKAPNQKVADMTVECGLEWTIEKLKKHLSDVYPSKPMEDQQKLIYSGKLLTDQQQLKDILHKFDEDQTVHTVHLVCAPTSTGECAYSKKSTTNSQPSMSFQQVPAAVATPSDGLRHRTFVTTAPTQPSTSQQLHYSHISRPQDAFQQQHGMNNAMMYNAGGYYPGMGSVSPQQMMWMQQMYAQQMAQYMQFYQAPYTAAPIPQMTNPLPAQHNPLPAQHMMAAGIQGEGVPDVNQAQQQPIRMNAQGGAVFDDDDEEGANRDWLDWLYTFSRFSVLLSILYFYSNIHRFMAVLGIFVFFYIYEAGWFRMRQRNAGAPQVAVAQQAREAQLDDAQRRAAAEEQPQDDENQAENSDTDSSSSETSEVTVVPPNQLEVLVRFFTSFFTSLIPQAPPNVNAN